MAPLNWNSFFVERVRQASKLRRGGPRRKPSPALRNEVLEFYELKCVIDNGFPGIHLHHLNECPADTEFCNLIPTGATYNDGIERDHRQIQLLSRLQPHEINAIARRAFDNGEYRRAHACNRIAAHLYRWHDNNNWTKAAEALVFAIAALRPEGRPDLLIDTSACLTALMKDHRLENSAYFWGAEFLSQLALVMYDHREVRPALRLGDLAIRLSSKCSESEHPNRLQDRMLRMFKRFALVNSPGICSLRERKTDELIGKLHEVRAEAKANPQGRSSAEFTEATLLRAMGHTKKAVDLAITAIADPQEVDKWTVVATKIELALCLKDTDRENAENHYKKAIIDAFNYKIKFIPVPEKGDLKDPIEILGKEFAPPYPQILPRGSNPFSWEIISWIIDALPAASSTDSRRRKT